MINREEVAQLTQEYGKDWGVNHAKRLLHLVSIIADGREYNEEAIWLAAYLHDWGGYQKWMQPGMEHYDRSVEVIREFLTERECPEDMKKLVLEIIAFHHGGDPDRSFESRIFTDADAIDLLGACGFARCFGMAYRDLQTGLAITKKFREMSAKALTTDKGRELAAKRIEETDQLLKTFEEETFGLL